MKIDFLGLGVQKAGTSTLHDILKTHSEIYLPDYKEIHFFDLTKNYSVGDEWLKEYMFNKYDGEKLAGEFTPEYIYMEKVPQRIFEKLGKDVKFIIIFRQPVERAISHYNMLYRRGVEQSDFFNAIKNETERIKGTEWDKISYSYMDRGLYSVQLKRYLALFPPENFLYLVFERDIVKNMKQTLERIQSFLGVKNETLDVSIKSNEAYEPYSVGLNRFIRSKFLQNTGRILFPKVFRQFLRNQVFKFNKKSNSKQLFNLTGEQKDELFYEYFYNDVKLLENMTKISFKDIWYTEER